MLIIPLTGKLSRHHLPIATLIIILINVVVYFTLQHDDSKYYAKARNFYFQSGLLDMEMKYYLAYRAGKSPVWRDRRAFAGR